MVLFWEVAIVDHLGLFGILVSIEELGVVIFHHISFLAQRPCHRICAQNKILQPTPSMAASCPCVRGGTSQLGGPGPSDAQVALAGMIMMKW